MASRKIFFIFLVLFLNRVESASLLERSYEYVMNLGKNLAPSLLTILECVGEEDAWGCAKERAGRILDKWDADVQKQRQMWQDSADAEVRSSGRAIEEMPSKLGKEVEESLTSLADMVQNGVARAMSRHHKEEPEINLAISTSGGKKKKKKKPTKIHLVHMPMEKKKEKENRGFNPKAQTWSIGDKINATNARKGRGIVADMWAAGESEMDRIAQHVLGKEIEEGKNDVGEMRGKKKKKKKAILKLLILGAVLKAKIGTLLQILSFKLQVKFFLIALVGLGINLARFWLDLKKQHQPPQKVIYYEHAQHQHHYDHEEEPEHGWGPWSRSMDPDEDDAEIDFDVNSPYRAQVDRSSVYSRPILAHAMRTRQSRHDMTKLSAAIERVKSYERVHTGDRRTQGLGYSRPQEDYPLLPCTCPQGGAKRLTKLGCCTCS